MKLLMTAIAVAGCGFFVLSGQQADPPAVYTAAQATAGRTAFQTWCAKCHTDTLAGRRATAQAQEVPALAGASFMARWGARTPQDLYARIQFIEDLGEEMHLNIAAYILQFNGARPGTQALTTTTGGPISSITAASGGGEKDR